MSGRIPFIVVSLMAVIGSACASRGPDAWEGYGEASPQLSVAILPFANRTNNPEAARALERRVRQELAADGFRILPASAFAGRRNAGAFPTPASLGLPADTVIVQGVLTELTQTGDDFVMRGMMRIAVASSDSRWKWEARASKTDPGAMQTLVANVSLKGRAGR